MLYPPPPGAPYKTIQTPFCLPEHRSLDRKRCRHEYVSIGEFNGTGIRRRILGLIAGYAGDEEDLIVFIGGLCEDDDVVKVLYLLFNSDLATPAVPPPRVEINGVVTILGRKVRFSIRIFLRVAISRLGGSGVGPE